MNEITTVQDALNSSTKMGRRTLLDDRPEKIIVDAVQAGATLKVASEAAGVSYAAVREWLRRGRDENDRSGDPEGVYAAFVQKVEAANARGEIALVARVRQAASESWQAAAWMLERKYSDRWAKKQTVNIRELTDEQLLRLIETTSTEGSGEEESDL
jgi:hypothetical protein